VGKPPWSGQIELLLHAQNRRKDSKQHSFGMLELSGKGRWGGFQILSLKPLCEKHAIDLIKKHSLINQKFNLTTSTNKFICDKNFGKI
jgi:hypothetical protein